MVRIRWGVLCLFFFLSACNGGGGGGGGGNVVNPPAAPTLAVAFSLKQFQFSWTPVAAATEYRLLEKADASSGYVQRGAAIAAGVTGVTLDVAVHRHDWINARYILQACNAGGCADSAPIDTSAGMIPTIGYFKATTAPIIAMDDFEFGSAVALSGDGRTLAVGAPGRATNLGNNAGGVYVFGRSGGAWSLRAFLQGSSTSGGDLFGSALALSDDGLTLAVGAWGEDSGSTTDPSDGSAIDAGAVFIYTSADGTNWTESYVKAANPKAGSHFGVTVSLNGAGTLLAVGAPVEDSAAAGVGGNPIYDCAAMPTVNCAQRSGAAYVYALSGGTWSEQAYIKASNTGEFDEFGYALALSRDGSTLVVGAHHEQSTANTVNGNESDNGFLQGGAGAAYVFRNTGGNWSQQAYIKPSNPGEYDHFGWAVALSESGNRLAIGAPGEDSGATGVGGSQGDNCAPADTCEAGAVYVFDFDGASWSQAAYMKASNTGTHDRFGAVLALTADGGTLAVGAAKEDSLATGINGDESDTGAQTGAVYLFRRSGSAWAQQSYIKATNTAANDEAGTVLALSNDGNVLAVGAPFEDSAAMGVGGDQADDTLSGAGAVYLY